MSVPYFPLYVADYEADTAHLTLEEDGAYLRLLRLCWRTPGCSIPNDPKWIARMMRVTWEAYERVVAPILSEFFRLKHNRYYSPRLQKEWERIEITHNARSEAGKRGNEKKWKKEALPDNALKSNEMTSRPAIAKVSQPEPEPEPYNTNANALDGDAVTAALWDRGVRFLVAHGSSERNARSVIGKWRKDASDQEIYDAFAACKRDGIVDPIPWITASLAKPKVDQDKIWKEIFDEFSRPTGTDAPHEGVSGSSHATEADRGFGGGSERRDRRPRSGGDEIRSPRGLGGLVAEIRGRVAEAHEKPFLAGGESN
jgi:uncharacterized protein YdaU (DUF1376 family)